MRTTFVTWWFAWVAGVSPTSGTVCSAPGSPITVGVSCGALDCAPCRRCRRPRGAGFSLLTSGCSRRAYSSRAMRLRPNGNKTHMHAPYKSVSRLLCFGLLAARSDLAAHISARLRIHHADGIGRGNRACRGPCVSASACLSACEHREFLHVRIARRAICIRQRYRSRARYVCDPRHACATPTRGAPFAECVRLQ